MKNSSGIAETQRFEVCVPEPNLSRIGCGLTDIFRHQSGTEIQIAIRHRIQIDILHFPAGKAVTFQQQWQLSVSLFWPASSPRPRPSPPALRECFSISSCAYLCSRCLCDSVGEGYHQPVQQRTLVAAARGAASDRMMRTLAGKSGFVMIFRCDIRARVCLVRQLQSCA